MLKVGRKRKEKKERKTKSTQTRLPGFELALLGQLLTSRAWNLHATKKTKYKIRSISEYFVRNNRATHLLKKESVTFQNIFSSMANFRDVVSVLPAARLIKTSRIFVAEQKANCPWEIKESFRLAFWLSLYSSTKHWRSGCLWIDWRQKKAQFSV